MANKKNNNVNDNMSNNNGTKVMCPVCGTEFAIGEHEHKVKNGVVVGKDSGLGDIYLPVSKRGDALKAAGIDTSKYFSIKLPTGGSQMMRINDDGIPVAVADDDPVMQAIVRGGTVPNRNLFRRWVMSQVFRGLSERDYHGHLIGFAEWLTRHGYEYQWKMLIDELHVQTRLWGKDTENYEARNRWFNKGVCVDMAVDFIEQLREVALNQKIRHCKGAPYIRVKGFDKGVFVEDIDKKLIQPLRLILLDIKKAKTAEDLEKAVRNFWQTAKGKEWAWDYKQCARWKDAYKGAGAYFTMQNLLRFHGCRFPKDNDFYQRGKSGLEMLDDAAELYHDEGWRLFGLMKQMIDENHIDIEKKRAEWREAKMANCAKRRR